MSFNSHALAGDATKIPINDPVPVRSFCPVPIPSPGRPVDIQLRVTFPATGDKLPIILHAHGHGRSHWLNSHHGYAPLVDFWAEHGFVVIQPTHLNSASLGLNQQEPGNEVWFKHHPKDMIRIIDELDVLEATIPELKGRLDRDKIAMSGHSLGSFTTRFLLGAKNTDPRDGSVVYTPEPRIKAGLIMASMGTAGESDLTDLGRSYVGFLGPDFSAMAGPALVVCGAEDGIPTLSPRGAEWFADAYKLAPGPKDLLWVKGAKHGLGGISGWDTEENASENHPERLEVTRRMTWAYLRSQLYEGDTAWEDACKALKGLENLGSTESKGK